MIFVIDNYDSFTYNFVQSLGEMGNEIVVRRNDEITIEKLEALNPRYLVISSGPSNMSDSGISIAAIRHFAGKIPIFGVSLGHQLIAQAFGSTIIQAQRLMLGKTSEIFHDGQTIFANIASPFKATRYHSLIVCRDKLPDCLQIAAETSEGEIMALRHKTYPIEGVQFHPESIMTEAGKTLLKNFFTYYGEKKVCSSI